MHKGCLYLSYENEKVTYFSTLFSFADVMNKLIKIIMLFKWKKPLKTFS